MLLAASTERRKLAISIRKYLINQFEKRGNTTHSGMAITLPTILNHCVLNKIPFRLEFTGEGYYIRKHPQFPIPKTRLLKSVPRKRMPVSVVGSDWNMSINDWIEQLIRLKIKFGGDKDLFLDAGANNVTIKVQVKRVKRRSPYAKDSL